MALIRRILLGALTWLTAASTLLAGIPRYQCECACEDQTLSRTGVSSCGRHVAGSAGCCCSASPGKRCCCTVAARKPDAMTQSPGGHRSQAQTVGEAAQASDHFQAPFCRQRLVMNEAAVAATPALKTQVDLSLPVVNVVSPCGLLLPRLTARHSCESHPVSPPTDLVVVFQHFLI